jgi:shikimate kinase
MARDRSRIWQKAFEKSFYRALAFEQQQKERQRREEEESLQRLLHPQYVLYVGGKAVHTCSEWYEAHTVYHAMYSIKEWLWLPISVTLNGKPLWGVNPQALVQDQREARRYKSNRTRYLNTCGLTEQEREECAQKQLQQIIESCRKVERKGELHGSTS